MLERLGGIVVSLIGEVHFRQLVVPKRYRISILSKHNEQNRRVKHT